MSVGVALLRGINVGGHHSFPMARLREVANDAGLRDATTYIQSGNLVFASTEPIDARLEDTLEERLGTAAGFAISVVVRSLGELHRLVAKNPFPAAGPTQLHVAFFKSDPPSPSVEALRAIAVPPDELVVFGREGFLHLPNGAARSKLANSLARPGVASTSRNWQTVTRLVEMAEAIGH